MTAGSRRAVGGLFKPNVDAERLHVVVEDPPELVVAYLADVGSRAAQVRKAGDRVRNRAARHFGRGAHLVIDLPGTVLVNQGHRAGFRADALEERVVHVGENVDNGIADAE